VIGAAYGKDKDGKPAELKIEPITLFPNHTVHIDLQDRREKDKSILADGAAGVRLSHGGGPTDVVTELLSIDEAGQVVFYDDVRSHFFYVATVQSAISFNLQDENRSFLIIKNTTDEPRKPRIILNYNDGIDYYEVNLKDIPPQQTEIIDFRHLRDAKIPDVSGHILPADLKFGGSLIFSEPGAFVISDPTFIYGSRPAPAGDPADNEPFFLPSCARSVRVDDPLICDAAQPRVNTLKEDLEKLNQELFKTPPDPRRIAILEGIVDIDVDLMIAELDSNISSGCCEPQLRNLEAQVAALPWLGADVQQHRIRLINAIRAAQVKARNDRVHC
jgi:hypothetical protein